ncbi:MAG: hypothetical protein M0009_09585 [Deltaproteobacteria bacterium]|nr:hypothetical protein [Deltaproteobacteria bacterium]
MIRLQYFLRSLNVLNGLLAAALALVAYGTVAPFLRPVAISFPTLKASPAPVDENATPPASAAATDYVVISNQNLFHPERKIPPEKPVEKVIPRPDVVLYGTVLAGERSFAFVEDRRAPYSTAGRGKRQMTLKKGDSLSGYIVSEIEANRIVLAKGEDKFTVLLDDRGKKRADETASSTNGRAASGGSGALQSFPAPAFPTVPLPSPKSAPSGKSSGIPGPTAPASAPASLPKAAPAGAGAGSSGPIPASSSEAAASSRPGIGGSGTWPPTRSTIEQTQQKIREGLQMRANQLQQNP